MRICHIITRLIRGGADENTVYCCNGQAARGHDVHLIHGSERDERMLERLDGRVRRYEVESLRREVSVVRDVRALAEIGRLLKRERPEIVHTHTSKAGVLGRLAAAVCRVPVVIHGVHILPFVNVGPLERIAYKGIEKFMARFTDAFVSVGEEMRASCIAENIGAANRHHVVYSGMDMEKFRKNATVDWREVLGEHEIRIENPVFLVLVSRLEERKGQREILRWMPDLIALFPNVVLLLAGEGGMRRELESIATRSGIGDHVVFTGFREDIENLLAISRIGLLTSKREGLPRVLVQYASMGLPAIATDIPGAREIVREGVTGFLVKPDRIEDMLPRLKLLLSDDGARRRMVEEIGKRDLSGWSIDGMNDRLQVLYERLMLEKTGNPRQGVSRSRVC
ncbi:MAG: glycosyltransferase family 4 protein [Deltaproteobacteria bacterium]